MKQLFESVRARRTVAALCLVTAVVVLAVAAPEAMAQMTKGAEFNDVYSLVKAWATGGLGKVISLAFLLVGLAIGVLRGSVIATVSCLSACVALVLGPSIIDALFTASSSSSS